MRSIYNIARLLCILFVSKTIDGVLVTIPDLGIIEGTTDRSAWTDRTIYQFLGVKFGKAPSGSLRFMPPEPVEPWTGVYNATSEGIECPQIEKFMDSLINISPDVDLEDCLSLNVYTPQIPNDENVLNLMPVMIFIHGGSFFEGSARYFPPNYLLEKDVILVVLQYRLGPLGFMSLHTDGIAGNMGLLDQVLGLKWVNKYIIHFGGDNSRVTVVGQSAGACSLALHLLSPIVDSSLFQQAIFMSGSAHAAWAHDLEPIQYAKNLYKVLANDTDDVEVDVSTIEQAFKTATITEFMQAVLQHIKTSLFTINKISGFVVQKAGRVKFISELPSDILKSGNFRTVPMMAGVTKNEGSTVTKALYYYMKAYNLLDDDEYIRNNLTSFMLAYSGISDNSDSLVDMLNNIYFKKVFDKNENINFTDMAPGITDITGNMMLKAQTLKQAKINARFMNKTYFYTFDYKGEHTRFITEGDTTEYPFDGGVHHSDDLLYLFPYPYTNPLNEEDTKMAKLMSELWTGFAIYGEPNSSLLDIDWPPIERNKNGPYLHINSTSYVSMDFVDNEFRVTSIESDLIDL